MKKNTECGQRLREAEESVRKLWWAVEQSADIVIITDRNGTIEYVNPAFESLTGYPREEAIGKNPRILKSGLQEPELYRELWATVLAGKVFRGTLANRKKNGELFYLEKTITPVRGADGEVTHFISNDRDITEQRRLEAQLLQAQKMDAIGKLAGGVAHDFNNLLMIISAYAELTLDALTPEHPLRSNLQEIMTAARRAADLTRQLLAFGRKQVQALQLLDLNPIVEEIGKMLPRLIGEDIRFVFVPGTSLGKIKADRVQMEQVLMNLAANARDAMPRGGSLVIETGVAEVDEAYLQRHSMVPPGRYVVLTVSDTGEGIPAEHQPHIFEPFYTTKEEGKGTGLGLATVYGIVKQSQGYIWVYSEAGHGTTFKIYLPQVSQQGQELRPGRKQDDCLTGTETILLVEDEQAVRHSAREFLTRQGYTVLEAGNGEDALRTAREYAGPIALMVTDVVMPNLSGASLAEILSRERPEMKNLFVSGYAEATILRHGIIDVKGCFLQKPFTLRDLARKVRQVLDILGKSASAGA